VSKVQAIRQRNSWGHPQGPAGSRRYRYNATGRLAFLYWGWLVTDDDLIKRIGGTLPAANPARDVAALKIAGDIESLANHLMEQLIEPSLGGKLMAPYIREDILCRMRRDIIDDAIARIMDERGGYLRSARNNPSKR
jgi:hypothetical protein